MKKRIISLFMALVMALSLLPTSVLAAENHDGQVHVIVENTTYSKADGAPWDGTLVDTWVELEENSTMMNCITSALDADGYSYSGTDQGYISQINGIEQMEASGESGWMGTLNDWFTNEGFNAFTVANGKLVSGDEIRVMHTKNGYGKDIGGDWSTTSDTSLSALSFSAGTLSPAFSKDVTAYTLTLTEPTDVKVSATATNKSNQVYLSVGETEYRRTAAIPTEGGTVLTIRCGDTEATTYTVTVKMDVPQAPPARRDGVSAEATANASVNEPYTLDLSTIFTDINGDALTYLVSVNGGTFQTADKDYSYTPAEEGTTTLTFKANDGTADSTDTYTVTLTAYDKVDAIFKGLSSSKLKSFRVYTYENEQIGKENLLENVSVASNTYTDRLPAGDYWVEGYDASGNCCGGIKVTVQVGEKNEFNLHVLYQIGVSNKDTDESGQSVPWKEGKDYTTSLTVKGASGEACIVKMGEFTINGRTTPSCLFIHMGSVEVTFTPTEKRSDDGYVSATFSFSNIQAAMDKSISQTALKMGTPIVVRAPLGATISAGYLKQSYYYKFAKSTTAETESEVIATFVGIPTDAAVFVRVQHPDGVTYWNFSDLRNEAPDQGLKAKMNDAGEIVITAEDLCIGDEAFSKDTIYRFENNEFDRGDIYLNINKRGYKRMSVGETFNLNVFRNWQAIEGTGNAYIALPDVHYQVVDVNGNPSDTVSIVPDKNNSSAASLTANKKGTAIVLVTYDAMSYPKGMGASESNTKGAYTAIWPECTGVFVVTVNEDGTGIQTNMTMDRIDAQIKDDTDREIDSEHDILFYLEDEGAEYSFNPEDGCTVTVARSTVDEKMTFHGFTSEGVSVAADGTVTVSGLTTGRHIIRVEKGGVANYQVVTARQVTLTLLDKDGKEQPMDTEFQPGDIVTLQFWGLLSPQEKLATAYNFNFKLHYIGADSTVFDSNQGGDYGVYNFSSKSDLQRITIKIPENWSGQAYQIKGALSKGGFAGAASHRIITYESGRSPVLDAPTASGILARLPGINLRVHTVKISDIYASVGESLKAQADKSAPIVGSIGGEWLVIDLARSGRTVPAGYYDNVVKFVKENVRSDGSLDVRKSTESSRVILALTAIGKDVTDVGGHNLLKGLDSMAYIQKQGINGPIWALIALDSHKYPTSGGDVTREKLVKVILDGQMDNGGWSLDDKKADVDMTAMAIQALAPYYKTYDAVKAAVDKALEWLSGQQQADGGFVSWDTANSESCAQVVVALTALGIDPTKDDRFIKNSVTVLDNLCSYYTQDDTLGKGFAHAGTEYNQMATEQAYYALAAYYRLVNKQTSLYDMSDVCIGHTFGDWTVAKAATCTEDGSRTHTCSVCGTVETEVIKALGHSLTAAAAKAATCTEAGNRAHWDCARCGKSFSDAAAKTEIAKDSWVIAKLGHDEATRAAVAATCYASGRTAETYCKRCGLVLTAGTTVPATGKHTYVNGVCTVCGVKNPAADVKSDAIKPVAGNDKAAADGSGMVIKADNAITDEVLNDIKAAVNDGAITVTVEDTLRLTTEQKAADGGRSALTEAAKNASGDDKQELTKLAEKLDALRSDRSRKNTQLEKVVDVTVALVKTENNEVKSVAQLVQLPHSVTVTVPITDELYTALQGKRVCVVRSHTDINGNVTTTELPAALGGTKGSYVLTFQTDKASAFAIVSYETVSSGHYYNGSGSADSGKKDSANTADDSQMVVWLGSAVLAMAGVAVLTRKKRTVR